MSSGLLDIIKRASLDAMDSNQPADLRIGTVVSVEPLRVQISSQLIIPTSLLIVPQHLTNYTIDVNVDWETNGGEEHQHDVSGVKTMLVYGALKVNDKVALLRKQGGQSYFILDRI